MKKNCVAVVALNLEKLVFQGSSRAEAGFQLFQQGVFFCCPHLKAFNDGNRLPAASLALQPDDDFLMGRRRRLAVDFFDRFLSGDSRFGRIYQGGYPVSHRTFYHTDASDG